MSEHYNTLLVAWLFMVLIGGWLLVNALIDLGARRVRAWLVTRGLLPKSRWDEDLADSAPHAKSTETPVSIR